MWKRAAICLTYSFMLSRIEDLRETMREVQHQTDLKTLLGSPEMAKRAAQFLFNTRLLPQFSQVSPPSEEIDVSDVDTGETEAEETW